MVLFLSIPLPSIVIMFVCELYSKIKYEHKKVLTWNYSCFQAINIISWHRKKIYLYFSASQTTQLNANKFYLTHSLTRVLYANISYKQEVTYNFFLHFIRLKVRLSFFFLSFLLAVSQCSANTQILCGSHIFIYTYFTNKNEFIFYLK